MKALVLLGVCAAGLCWGRQADGDAPMREVVALAETGNYVAAREKLHAMIEQLRSQGPSARLARAWNNLGWVEVETGHYSDAERAYREAVRLFDRGPAESLDRACALSNLGELYGRQHRYSKAEQALRESLEIRLKRLPPNDPVVANSLNNLAALFQAERRFGEAEALYRRVLSIWQGDPKRQLRQAVALNNLATVLGATGRNAEAAVISEQAVEIAKQALGPVHPGTANLEANLAAAYLTLGRYAESERLLVRALANSEAGLGPEHPQTVRILQCYAVLLRRNGRKSEAKTLEARAREVRSRHPEQEPDRYSVDIGELLAFRPRK